MKPNEYFLKDYADFMALTDEQFEHMIIDWRTWRAAEKEIKAQVDQIYEVVKLTQPEIKKEDVFKLPDCFHWIDDNFHDNTIGAVVTDEHGNIMAEAHMT